MREPPQRQERIREADAVPPAAERRTEPETTPVPRESLVLPPGPGKALPPDVRADMGRHFGQDFSRVRVHADRRAGRAAETLGARAYTLGSDIVFGPGQFAPHRPLGRALLAHELAHVVQQEGARPALQQKPAVASPGTRAERTADGAAADIMAAEAVGAFASPSLRLRDRLRRSPVPEVMVQRQVGTWGGKFKTDTYKLTKNKGMDGVDIVLRFTPNKFVDAKKIGMTQTARSLVGGAPVPTKHFGKVAGPVLKARTIPAGKAGAGARVDRVSTHGNPLYAAAKPAKGDTLGATATVPGWGQHGWRFTDKAGNIQKQDALLKDTPQMPSGMKKTSQTFETTALAVEGVQEGTYYGSVQWGWEKDAAGKVKKLPLSLVSEDIPSGTFAAARELWNKGKTSGGTATLDLPSAWRKFTSTPGVWLVSDPSKYKATRITKLDKNDRVEVTDKGAKQPFNRWDQKFHWWKITVTSGTHVGKVGWVMQTLLSDKKTK